uniref:ATP-binding protein n=1 Tax=Steinernema glaseri TaxID=37863 RepID=A0A1I7YQT7_9BILA
MYALSPFFAMTHRRTSAIHAEGDRRVVDARLAMLLGQGYSSTEKALKELVDNAWDADAEEVIIVLPEPVSDQPIVVSDNGNGMTVIELRSQYMKIASDCRLRRGERTLGKQRQAADIEHVPIDIAVSICGEGDHGTSIHLTHLRQDLSYPNPVQLRQELIKE